MGVYRDPEGWLIDGGAGFASRDGDTRPLTVNEQFLADEIDTARLASDEYLAAAEVLEGIRRALTDVLALAALYPFPTVEETAIVDTQAVAALAAYRALADPPADVVSLASAVVAWRVAL